jgi:hypothetical protein
MLLKKLYFFLNSNLRPDSNSSWRELSESGLKNGLKKKKSFFKAGKKKKSQPNKKIFSTQNTIFSTVSQKLGVQKTIWDRIRTALGESSPNPLSFSKTKFRNIFVTSGCTFDKTKKRKKIGNDKNSPDLNSSRRELFESGLNSFGRGLVFEICPL